MPPKPAATATAAPAARTYAGQAPAERVAQRRQRFVAAGVQLFGSLGYHGTTMRTLTAEAGLSNRYFYESFATLEDLLVACYEHEIAAYRARLAQALAAAPATLAGQAQGGVRCFFEAMRSPHFARLTQVEVLGVSPRVDALYGRTMREFGTVVLQSLQHGGLPVATTAATRRQHEVVAVALAGAMTVAGALWVRTRYRDSIDTVTQATLAIVLGTARQLGGQPTRRGSTRTTA